MSLKNKKIVLGVTGGIASYKAIELAGKLTKAGAKVKVIMTENAQKFITPLTFAAITREKVFTKEFQLEVPIAHITLADWADLILIAPATANSIAKINAGIADDLLTSTVLAATSPVLICPAMNINMFENKITQGNINSLKENGFRIMEPESGMLACGYSGKGRLPAADEIVYFAESVFLEKGQRLDGLKILITTGGCREKIDPMRFIGNLSSGKTGLAIARAAFFRGADVTLVYASTDVKIPEYLNSVKTLSAKEMSDYVLAVKDDFDIILKAAAVADYTIENPASEKIKKNENFSLELVRTNDILLELGKTKKENTVLAGFAAESENIVENAEAKLKKKNLDLIIGNNINVTGSSETSVVIIGKDKKEFKGSKFETAHEILHQIKKILEEKRSDTVISP
ncbi:MAG: bifunctional phosphopantothenoylcysteine decarboxylase/phosphopantothenate--cysteine ligase CoaBC [Candidatus Cloacimonadota bacterium]|nr:MAG: bifunctional phosphopantothenoylcysteine decarboxylase/phosphopantothenate--cysteine ligase CoaBC [Candidatus Cloacimonadota bacterium]